MRAKGESIASHPNPTQPQLPPSRSILRLTQPFPAQVQWRFQFGKYKARAPSNKGNCGECKLKTVAFSYRSLCDKCAKERRLCPGCVKPPELARLADGDGAPSDGEGDGDGSSDEDLDGVVITHLSDDDDAGAEA